jgi:hypothetical protein
LQAHHLWLPEIGTATFPAVAEPVEIPATDDAGVLLTAMPSLEQILIDGRGRQHVVLRANGTALQLIIEGADITGASVRITFLVRGLAALRQASDHLATLRRILSPSAR